MRHLRCASSFGLGDILSLSRTSDAWAARCGYENIIHLSGIEPPTPPSLAAGGTSRLSLGMQAISSPGYSGGLGGQNREEGVDEALSVFVERTPAFSRIDLSLGRLRPLPCLASISSHGWQTQRKLVNFSVGEGFFPHTSPLPHRFFSPRSSSPSFLVSI